MNRHDEMIQIIERNSNAVYRLAFAQMKNRADADDVYQEVFYRYIKKQPVFENEEHEKAWFIRVTVNCSKQACALFGKQKYANWTHRLRTDRWKKRIYLLRCGNFRKNTL